MAANRAGELRGSDPGLAGLLRMTTTIPVGVEIQPWGRVIAMGCLQGRRFYWLSALRGIVMLPAHVIESQKRQFRS